MSDQTNPQPAPRRRRWLSRILWGLFILLVGLPLLLLGGLYLALQTEGGRATLATLIEDVVSSPDGLQLEIGRLDGPLPQQIVLRDLVLRDPEGVLIDLDWAELAWRPWSLLQRRVEIEHLRANRLELQRLPAGSDTEEEPAPSDAPLDIALPELPVSLQLEQLEVQELYLGQEIAGTPALLGLSGRARVDREGALDTQLAVERKDEQPGRLDLELALTAGGERLTARIDGAEPAGGLIAELLDLPERPPVSIRLEGDGPPEGWRAQLVAEADATARLEADLLLHSLEPLDLSLEAKGQATALVPEDFRSLVGDEPSLALRVQRTEEGALRVQDLRAGVAALQATGHLALQADGQTLDGALDLELLDPEAIAALTQPARFDGAILNLTVNGSLNQPILQANANLTALSLPEATAESLRLTLDAKTEAPLDGPEAAVLFDISFAAEALEASEAALEQLADGDLTLQGQGRYGLAEKRLTVIALDAGLNELALSLWGEATLADAGPTADLGMRLDHPKLERFAGLSGLDLSGALGIDLQANLASDGSLDARLNALTDRLQLGIPIAEAVLGERPGLSMQLRRDASGRILLDEARLDAATAALTAWGTLDAAFSEVDAGYRLDVSALEPLGDALGQPLGGSLSLEGIAQGALATPRVEARLTGEELSLPGEALRTLNAALNVDLDAPGPRGRLEVNGSEGQYGPLSSEVDFQLVEQELTLDNLNLRLGDAASVSGNLVWPLDGRPGRGAVEGNVPQLGALASIAGVEAGGSLTLNAELLPQEAQQALRGTLALRSVRMGPASEPSVTGERVDMQFTLSDLLGAPGVQAGLTAAGLSAGGAEIETAEINATGDLAALRIDLDADGQVAEDPLRLRAQADVGLEGPITRIQLPLLTADWGEETVALASPATLTIAPNDLALQSLDLTLLGGSLAGEARQEGDTIQADLRLADIPLDRLADLAGGSDVTGELSGELSLAGSMNAPRGQLNLFADDFASGTEAELSDRPPLDIRADATLEPGRLQLTTRMEGFAERPLSLDADLPLRLSLAPFAIDTIAERQLSARLQWSGDMAPVMSLMPVDTLRLTGQADIDLTAYGTLNAPQLGGQLALTDARYENYTSGTLLDPLELVVVGAGNTLTIERFNASDSNDGNMDGRGTVTWLGEEGVETDLRVTLNNMRLAQRDDVTARISGEIDVIGNPMQRAEVIGRLTNDFIEVRLVDALPPSVAEIEVVEVRAGEPVEPVEEPDTGPPAPSPILLDVEIDLPRRVFVRGRGLESEWGGRFRVEGHANDPQISGQLEPLRGSFTVIGKTFMLQEGAITLPVGASSLDPELDLHAVYTGSGFTAIVGVEGTASDPQIALSSQPEMPQDEILSRVLFNKTSANLSALEAVELADAAASLATGGPGVTALMRRAVGVDVLGFKPGANEDDPGAVAIGTYLDDGIYVGVEQGLGSSGTGVSVEIDITDQIKAHSDVGADGRSRAGVRWQMDY
ncbi:translocation/assembly module TamB domain-containing protein [Aquibaculum arenosum]|uniref:Translocation/assembly module TamB domain-containing protein n=1 Tax=Aquibaculum arenosum TaxID=3032591 RepID=A0ABT5YLI8_9PROT|nr:translocation/assembly module TamB domain-containing protein [Fodinicurvata sp. CAU 1616]MDF2095124.1 translocation/assembly module TamB domain-containing protein [Fodinicurvata sp. CAU 1616]